MYRMIEDGYITNIGQATIPGLEITEDEYNEILSALRDKPASTETTDYRLRADLTWEQFELPEPSDEPTAEDKAEAYDILTGVTP